jgi:hypothetical protein
MKKLFLSLLAFGTLTALSQPAKKGKEMHMTPIFAPGYYVNLKGDTVRGEVQTNLEKEISQYISFIYKPKGAAKGSEITPKKAKAYGYDDVHFTMLKLDEQNDVYIKYLEIGRLVFLEYKFLKIEDKVEKIKTIYFIKDTKAASDDKSGTGELNQLPSEDLTGFKKALKPFFKDQPILLDQVDKWYFRIAEIRKAVREFNAMYTQ